VATNQCLVHVVGSMPLSTVEEVMTTTAAILGSRVRRLTNGEIGRTGGWIVGHFRIFARHASFEEYVHDEKFDPRAPNIKRRRFRLKPDASSPNAESFGNLGYAEDAAEAYAFLSQMKRDGTVDAVTRLLVAIPSPYDILNFAVSKDAFTAVMPAYEEALAAEVARIAAAVPCHELAIQWDAAHEFEYLATLSPMFHHMTRDEMIAMLVRLGNAVPADVELGYHCCYGNFNLKHFVEPIDMSDMVDVMNKVIAALHRSVQFMHMPVPIDRTDDGYFAPLKNLQHPANMEFYLGLAHDGDGVPGTLKRADAARKVVSDFGISTECGLGMRKPDNIRQLLNIQAEAAREIDRRSARPAP
jgi:methionine synthase II (cobalamin-independent)